MPTKLAAVMLGASIVAVAIIVLLYSAASHEIKYRCGAGGYMEYQPAYSYNKWLPLIPATRC